MKNYLFSFLLFFLLSCSKITKEDVIYIDDAVTNGAELVFVEKPHPVPNGQGYVGDSNLNHNSWCHNMVFYDGSKDVISLFYTSSAGHGVNNNYSVLQLKQRGSDKNWSNPVLVGDPPSQDIFWYSSCAAIDNGEYIIIAKAKASNKDPLYMLKSSDNRIWKKELVKDSYGDTIKGDGPCCLTKLPSGRWIFYLLSQINGTESFVCYSDDEMRTWNKVPILPPSGVFCYPSEGDFYVCSDGEIILIMREGSDKVKKHPLLYSSIDNGLTWKFKKELTGMDCHSSPVCIIKDENKSKIILFYSSRWVVNGTRRINYLLTDENSLKIGNLIGERTIAWHKENDDIGYCSGVIDSEGLINLFWYAGSINKSQIITAIMKWDEGVCADFN